MYFNDIEVVLKNLLDVLFWKKVVKCKFFGKGVYIYRVKYYKFKYLCYCFVYKIRILSFIVC